MKKFFRISFIVLFIFFIAISFMFFKTPAFKKYLSSASALDNTCDVVFYSEDRLTPLYEVNDFPIGSSLNSNIYNNILKNPSFIYNNVNNQDVYYSSSNSNILTLNDWYLGWGDGSLTFSQNKGAVILNSSNFINLSQHFTPYQFNDIGYYTLNFFGENLDTSLILWLYYYNGTENIYLPVSNYIITDTYVSCNIYIDSTSLQAIHSSSYIECGVQFSQGENIVVSSASLYYSSVQGLFYDIDYIKRLYFNNQSTYDNFDDFDIYFTDDYYDYTYYFDSDYVVSSDVSIYPVFVTSPFYNIQTDYILSSSSSSLFENKGANLLNDINLSAIDYNVINLDFSDFFTCTFSTDNLFNGYQVGHNFIKYDDFNGNTFYFYCYVFKIGGMFDDYNYQYDFYLYDNEIKTQVFSIPSFPYLDFVVFDSNGYKMFGDELLTNEQFLITRKNLNFRFDIEYNMQFYYVSNFGVSFDIYGIDMNDVITGDICFIDGQNRSYFLENYFNTYQNYFLLTSENLKNSYIRTVVFDFSAYDILSSNFDFSSYDNLEALESALYSKTFTFSLGNPKIYYSDSSTDSNISIVPTTSDGLYKQKENWYDFTTDLYNFVIYLFFDAPIISNITSLIYVIVSLMIKVVEIIIGLFGSLSSTIFISAILGFMFFKFIIKKFLGGE